MPVVPLSVPLPECSAKVLPGHEGVCLLLFLPVPVTRTCGGKQSFPMAVVQLKTSDVPTVSQKQTQIKT